MDAARISLDADEWELGVTVDTIYPAARSLLIERFRQPPMATQEQLWSLFEQAQAARTGASSAATELANKARTEVRVLMVRSLTEADWQALIQAAVSALKQYLHTCQANLKGDDSAP